MAVSEKGLRLRIVTRLGERCTAVPLQVQDSDNTKLEVHGLFKKRLKRQDKERGASVPLWMQENDEPK